MNRIITSGCCYCGKVFDPDDLRPYGEGGELTCEPCGRSPEHIEETVRRMNAHLERVLDQASATGAAVILGDGTPRVSMPPAGMVQ